ncbi:MAG: hypothetical protein QGH40_16780 [bacterium]|jgi:hypothetical protein|nr:hypothetical protein [bacterium]
MLVSSSPSCNQSSIIISRSRTASFYHPTRVIFLEQHPPGLVDGRFIPTVIDKEDSLIDDHTNTRFYPVTVKTARLIFQKNGNVFVKLARSNIVSPTPAWAEIPDTPPGRI